MKPSWGAVLVVYGAGLLQGAAFVLIPALGVVLKTAPYHLAAGSYGMLFLPQIVGAIVSGLLAGVLQRHWGANGAFRLGLACNVAAGLLLAASVLFAGAAPAYVLLLTETALLGLGFGLTLAVINDLATQLFPQAPVAAVTVLNAVIGGATAFSPLVLHGLNALHAWWLWPLILSAFFLLTLLGSVPFLRRIRAAAPKGPLPAGGLLLLFAAVVLIYAAVEGTFGSWASLYLARRHGSVAQGTLALTAFWTAMTVLRLGLSMVPARRLSRRIPYLIAPWAMAACLVLIGVCTAPVPLIVLFAAAGLACGIFYPYSMSFALASYPQAATRVAGILVAALMAGEGIGSYLPGLLQHGLSLGAVYGLSALWCAPLFLLAVFIVQRKDRLKTGGQHAVSPQRPD